MHTPLGLLIFVFFTFGWVSRGGAVTLPKNLDKQDRKELMRIMGVSTSSKLLTNPFPLGGYSGLEVGLAVEVIDTTNLSRLGDKVDKYQPEFRYPRVSIGKGLYNDVDIFLNFTPFSSNHDVSEYGGLIKWSAYQADYLPVNLSLVAHGSVINVSDSFVNKTIGAELVAGISVENFSLYFGGGRLQSSGRFVAGDGYDSIVSSSDPDVNSGRQTVQETLTEVHSFIGISFHLSQLFAALQIDRYKQAAYSAKIGIRL